MKVEIWFHETSQPVVHEADNTYTKGPFFCVAGLGKVCKYPIRNIWRVREDYGPRVTGEAEIRG